MRLRTVVALGVMLGGAAVACGSDDDSTGSTGGSAGAAGHAGTAGSGGTKNSGGTAGSAGTKSAGGTSNTGGTSTSGGRSNTGGTSTSGGTTNTGGTSTSGGTGGSSTAGRGGAGARGGTTGLGGSLNFGGAGEGGAGEGGAGEGGVANGTGGTTTSAGGAGSDAGGAGGEGGAVEGPKQPLDGLIDMQVISWHNTDSGVPTFKIADLTPFPGQIGGIVINVAWNQLQPTEGTPIDYQPIDDALADVKAYNDANPTQPPVGVKLRVYSGSTAPDWVKALSGGPVPITRNQAGCSTYPTTPCPIHVPLFWDATYISAWRALQAALAARYDDNPLIRQVAVTSCAAQTDEPFVTTTDPDARDTLVNDFGYTDALEKACLSGAIDDYAAWKRTLIDFTFNPFNKVGGGLDADFTISVMDDCRARLGSRCVIGNHALAWPLGDSNLQPVYDEIQRLGGPINFQTQSPNKMSCQWTGTLALGVSVGARAIEVWPTAGLNGFDSLSTEQVGTLVSEFTNPTGAPSGSPVGDCPDFN